MQGRWRLGSLGVHFMHTIWMHFLASTHSDIRAGLAEPQLYFEL